MASINKLSEAAVRQAKPKAKAYRLADGAGMYLEVTPTGSRYWRLKYRHGGKEKRLALGVYPNVTLATAREKARDAKDLLQEGIDPSEAKKQAKLQRREAVANTFTSIGAEYVEKRRTEGAAAVTIEKLQWIVNKKLCPHIGGTPVMEITPAMLLGALRRIEADGLNETAHRAKRVAGQVLRYAVVTGRCDRDISQDLKGALVAVKATHRAAITDPKELGPLLIAIDSYSGTMEVATALKLTPILFQRPGELRHMEWSELDLELERWEIPADKMKMRQPHVVPLPDQALALLKAIHPLTGSGRYVFPSARRGGRPLSEAGVLAALRTLGYDKDKVTPHGFRATARTLLDEVLGFRVDYIEQQLAHAVKDANGRAYNRTKYLPERKAMMQGWADYLDTLKAEVLTPTVVAGDFRRAN
ncbi:tyrosine-type recombinase/integrase [Gilvimarinus polysaccharolyticus]|uniref:tyrosine-type recombinase/integrase n=1 Tax=Gilvimarinus polysaccharolyticus TaxID=863921 RepID=UPI0006733161|nr:integrase arm-type DNA-binding domain-containing protein [Gilvimarinus polysaccharolyticus]